MASIFDIITWNNLSTYSKNDIVRYPSSSNNYLYALSSVSAGVTPSLSSGQTSWGGIKSNNGKDRPHFLWVPSYASSSTFAPIVKVIKFGDGYEQRVTPNINNNLLKIDLRFDLRTDQESRAMLHFLHARAGLDAFIFEPPNPLNSEKDQFFVCRGWNNTFNFFDNQSMSLTFEQTASY